MICDGTAAQRIASTGITHLIKTTTKGTKPPVTTDVTAAWARACDEATATPPGLPRVDAHLPSRWGNRIDCTTFEGSVMRP
jgi:hypothetical protein